MNKTQERKFSMYEVVHALLVGTIASIIDQMPLMSDAIVTLGHNISSISGFGSTQKMSKEGVSDTKGFLRLQLIQEILLVSKKVSAYATNTGNMVLLKEVKYSKSAIEKLPENILVIVGNIVYGKAKDNLSSLATYGVTDEVLVLFQKAIANYDSSIPQPRTSIVVKKIATTNLKSYFTATDALLKDKMDVLVGVVQYTQTGFYANYINSRKIITAGNHPMSIRAKVVSDDGMPIAGVLATVEGIAKSFITKKKGYFYVKSFEVGTYTFTFSKEGYVNQDVTVVVNAGERSDVTVTLSAVGLLSKAS